MSIIRCYTIIKTLYHFGLYDLIVQSKRLTWLANLPRSSYCKGLSLPIRIRLALENLGPVFVKFGQVLSTRLDLLPKEYADELIKLQDNVPPFSGERAQEQIERSLKKPLHEIFTKFDLIPIASASVAQVHRAEINNPHGTGTLEVAVKVLRPDIKNIIEQDIALMRTIATWVNRLFVNSRRLRLLEVVNEFDYYLHDELDLMHEAANASQIGRNCAGSKMIIVPVVYFDYCSRDVMTMQWMNGVPISQLDTLREMGIDLKQLSRFGVEIFFEQVFRHGLFHADMHPGNILVAKDGRYIGLDYGIVGSLTEHDKHYLIVNFLAFFNRDYHRVATAHIESGWVPAGTSAEQLEAAIRAVCEPIFEKPLSQISFGIVLLRMFETCRRFKVEVQPQLILLQKTLLNIEGMGCQLDPELDLWKTAKPYLNKWMDEQIGFRSLLRSIRNEAPEWISMLPKLPRKINEAISRDNSLLTQQAYLQLMREQKRQNFLLILIVILMLILLLIRF